jgi:hypothetical protein
VFDSNKKVQHLFYQFFAACPGSDNKRRFKQQLALLPHKKRKTMMREPNKIVMLLSTLLLITAASGSALRALSQPPPPNPNLYLVSQEHYTANGKNWIRYNYDVLNKDEYPAEMFAAAPALPPCGLNTKASRTWVDFYDSRGKRLYGFCALGKPADLGSIWFAQETDVIPPSYVYIELTDRQTNVKYKSNLAETTQ